jgi:hypothetical protein
MAESLVTRAVTLAFGELPEAAILALREGTEWRHFIGGAAARFAGLLSVPALDAFLATDAARAPRVSMADAARQGSAGVPDEEFCLADGRVDPLRLLARFDAGATLVVSQMQEVHGPLAGFCRGLEKLFLHAVQANAYLTPPGAQGFRVHYDTHDVLVLQVEGEKAWHVWPGQPLPHPTRRTPWSRDLKPAGPPVALTLRPGEALYLPRGTLHEAMGQRGASLHLTIGLLEPCWAEAMRLLLDAAEAEEAALRAPFPAWRLADPAAAAGLLEGLAARLRGLADPRSVERISLGLLDGLAAQRVPLPGRGLLTRPPGPEERLRLTERMHHHVAALPDGVAELRWSGGRRALAGAELGWLEALAEGAVPPPEAQAFCRELFALGLLERD